MYIGGHLPDEIHNALAKLLTRHRHCDKAKWPQITKLKPEDVAKFRKHSAETAALARQAQTLLLKLKAIDAKAQLGMAAWWDLVHTKYGLPADGAYHITQDGRVLMQPRDK